MRIHLTTPARQAAGLVVLFLLLLACQPLTSVVSPVRLHSTLELRQLIETSELFCHSGTLGNVASDNFYIADRPFDYAASLAVADRLKCGLTPMWRGVVWVTDIKSAAGIVVDTAYIGGRYRIWGNVLIAGDENLMDQLEALYHRRSDQVPAATSSTPLPRV